MKHDPFLAEFERPRRAARVGRPGGPIQYSERTYILIGSCPLGSRAICSRPSLSRKRFWRPAACSARPSRADAVLASRPSWGNRPAGQDRRRPASGPRPRPPARRAPAARRSGPWGPSWLEKTATSKTGQCRRRNRHSWSRSASSPGRRRRCADAAQGDMGPKPALFVAKAELGQHVLDGRVQRDIVRPLAHADPDGPRMVEVGKRARPVSLDVERRQRRDRFGQRAQISGHFEQVDFAQEFEGPVQLVGRRPNGRSPPCGRKPVDQLAGALRAPRRQFDRHERSHAMTHGSYPGASENGRAGRARFPPEPSSGSPWTPSDRF